MAGMSKEKTITELHSLPILSALPIIGRLFELRTTQTDETTIVVSLTAKKI